MFSIVAYKKEAAGGPAPRHLAYLNHVGNEEALLFLLVFIVANFFLFARPVMAIWR